MSTRYRAGNYIVYADSKRDARVRLFMYRLETGLSGQDAYESIRGLAEESLDDAEVTMVDGRTVFG